MDRKHFVERWGSAMQAIGATVVVLGFATTGAFKYHDAYADDRYVLKGELKESVEAIGAQIGLAVKAGDERAEAEKLRQVEAAIVDLEDDIIWFSENDNMPSAKRRCRKLTRAVREWNELNEPVRWVSDRIVQGVCDQ